MNEGMLEQKSSRMYGIKDWNNPKQELTVGVGTTMVEKKMGVEIVAFATANVPNQWRYVPLDVLLQGLCQALVRIS